MLKNGVKLLIDGKTGFGTLTLCNPKKHNAFNAGLISSIRDYTEEIRKENLRGLFVNAEGKSFCAGADLNWMKEQASASREDNIKDALNLSGMLNDIASLNCPTVCLVQGNTFGGGVGLVSACDISVSIETAKFTLSEVKLGLIPATIAPYVMRRIGAQQSRRYFLTAETFDAPKAKNIGLLNEVVSSVEELSSMESHFKKHFNRNGPNAMSSCKELIDAVFSATDKEEMMEDTAKRLASQRETDECKEGITAFFEKRKAAYNLE